MEYVKIVLTTPKQVMMVKDVFQTHALIDKSY